LGTAEFGTKPAEPAEGFGGAYTAVADEEWVLAERIGDGALGMADEDEEVFLEVLGGVKPEIGAVGEQGRRDQPIATQDFLVVPADPNDR